MKLSLVNANKAVVSLGFVHTLQINCSLETSFFCSYLRLKKKIQANTLSDLLKDGRVTSLLFPLLHFL